MSGFPKTVVTDAGKKLEVIPLDPGDMLDFFEVFSANQTSKPAFIQYVTWICSVRTVNGVPIEFPRDTQAVKTLGREIGFDGLDKVRKALQESGEGQSDEDAAKN